MLLRLPFPRGDVWWNSRSVVDLIFSYIFPASYRDLAAAFKGCICYLFHLLLSCYLLTKVFCASCYASLFCYLPSEFTLCVRGCLEGLRDPLMWLAARASSITKAAVICHYTAAIKLLQYILKLPYLLFSNILYYKLVFMRETPRGILE